MSEACPEMLYNSCDKFKSAAAWKITLGKFDSLNAFCSPYKKSKHSLNMLTWMNYFILLHGVSLI